MKERPILFNTEMVKAILNGRKTQSRRPVKESESYTKISPCANWSDGFLFIKEGSIKGSGSGIQIKCPFGQISDRLYVRETWAETIIAQDINLNLVPVYKACDNTTDYGGPWKPSIHMPKKYARIWLEITDIRVERVQDITQEDAKKEGYDYIGWSPSYSDPDSGGDGEMNLPIDQFFENWEKIYGKDNQWVWVIEFKRIENNPV